MKKFLSLLLAMLMVLSLAACGGNNDQPANNNDQPRQSDNQPADNNEPAPAEPATGMDALIDAAKAEGELVVYGSCEEEYLAAACENFEHQDHLPAPVHR